MPVTVTGEPVVALSGSFVIIRRSEFGTLLRDHVRRFLPCLFSPAQALCDLSNCLLFSSSLLPISLPFGRSFRLLYHTVCHFQVFSPLSGFFPVCQQIVFPHTAYERIGVIPVRCLFAPFPSGFFFSRNVDIHTISILLNFFDDPGRKNFFRSPIAHVRTSDSRNPKILTPDHDYMIISSLQKGES